METKETTYNPTLSEIAEAIKSHIQDRSGLEANHIALDLAELVEKNSAEDNAEYSHDEFLKQCGMCRDGENNWVEGDDE